MDEDALDYEDLFGDEDDDPQVATFTARYESECATCGNMIYEGDLAGYIGSDTEASCEACLP